MTEAPLAARPDTGRSATLREPIDVRVKRIFEPPAASDGERVLVDGDWPAGWSDDDACVDGWERDLAPSTELRRWFANDPARFEEFPRRYARELTAHESRLWELRRRARARPLTLVHATRATERSAATVLAEILQAASPPSTGREEPWTAHG